ncbi:hypothetical protein NDU88_005817 [Pleurodeles waltl]|uniref:Uncharacterized protein n=1 Tax=Pleurodeles waltl TaxID=8319 RepID=A0AAV7W8V7_PLEWA|nr:hypothetical protein NDU88_005817 [Pleurodeles waltl]
MLRTGVRPSNGAGALVVPRRSTLRQRGVAAPLLLFPVHGQAVGAPGPRATTSLPTANSRSRQAPRVRPKARRGRGGSRGVDSPISSGTPRRPPPSAPASTRSPPLTHRNAASSGRRSIYAVAATWAQIMARTGNLFPHPAGCSERSLAGVRQFPRITDKLSPHSSPTSRQNLHFRRAWDGSSGIRRPPS